MLRMRSIHWAIIAGVLVAALADPKPTLALSTCGGWYVAQEGETLWSIANTCGTTVDAIRNANANIGYFLYAGQTVWVPGTLQGNQASGSSSGYRGGQNCYTSQSNTNCPGYQQVGSCYGGRYGWSAHAAQGAMNAATYVVRKGDTLREIAGRMGIPLCDLILANPQIANPDLIYPGQIICLPAYMGQSSYHRWDDGGWKAKPKQKPSNMYTVQRGETLKEIARKYDLTVESILALNPTIKKPSYIHAGQEIRLW